MSPCVSRDVRSYAELSGLTLHESRPNNTLVEPSAPCTLRSRYMHMDMDMDRADWAARLRVRSCAARIDHGRRTCRRSAERESRILGARFSISIF